MDVALGDTAILTLARAYSLGSNLSNLWAAQIAKSLIFPKIAKNALHRFETGIQINGELSIDLKERDLLSGTRAGACTLGRTSKPVTPQ
jgi:hypothetical protein